MKNLLNKLQYQKSSSKTFKNKSDADKFYQLFIENSYLNLTEDKNFINNSEEYATLRVHRSKRLNLALIFKNNQWTVQCYRKPGKKPFKFSENAEKGTNLDVEKGRTNLNVYSSVFEKICEKMPSMSLDEKVKLALDIINVVK